MTKMIVIVSALALVLGPQASSAVNRKPTPRAIAYWKTTALKPPKEEGFWKGYLSAMNAHLTSCKFMRSRGVVFYDCHVTGRIDGTVFAFAALTRLSRCQYASTLSSTQGNHTLTRRFRLCG
jgi:hypothetical protein